MSALWISLAALLLQGRKYCSEEEALQQIFTNREKIVKRQATLDRETKIAVARRVGAVRDSFTLFIALKKGRPVGFAVITEEITRTEPVIFMVGVGTDGKVLDVVVLEHREHIGTECARRRFLNQFEGKDVNDPLRLRKYLRWEVGATLSCKAIARGTRRVLALVHEYCIARPENVRALLIQDKPDTDVVTQKRMRMGTICTISARGPRARAGIRAAFAEIRRVEEILSDYIPESELSKLNAAGRIEQPSGILSRFLTESIRYSKLSEGAFDITVGSLMKLWGFRGGEPRVPSEEALREAVVGYEGISIDSESGEVRLKPGLRLDPGAIGKGLALDRALEALRAEGVKDAILDFGSTTIAIGKAPGLEGWPVGIRNPRRPDEIAGTLVLKNQAVSVSGNYEKFFERDGKRYTHILDPRTKRPVDHTAAVTVLAGTATEADALSTAIFVLGPKKGIKLAETLEGVEAELYPVAADARPIRTSGWPGTE